MPKCPLCNNELQKKDQQNWECRECCEIILGEYAKESEIPCCNPLKPCK